MQALLIGEVVDLDRNEWEFNGRTGVSFAAFVAGSRRDSPQRVRITEDQHRATQIGVTVEWPVSIIARESNYGAPTLRVTLDKEFSDVGDMDGETVRAGLAAETSF